MPDSLLNRPPEVRQKQIHVQPTINSPSRVASLVLCSHHERLPGTRLDYYDHAIVMIRIRRMLEHSHHAVVPIGP